MQRCPRCGVRNLDSDIVCFNCEELLLTGDEIGRYHHSEDSSGENGHPVTLEEPIAEETAMPSETVRKRGRRPTFASLLLGTLLQKVLGLLLAFGFFSIVALMVMWLDYTNPTAFFVCLGVLAAASLAALFYPGLKRAGINGRKGGILALLSDLAILAALLPPAVFYLERKLSGASEIILRYHWAIPALVILDFLFSQAAGSISRRRAAKRRA